MNESRRELLQIVFAACRDYLPSRYPGKVTLLRAKVRPLLHDDSEDLGWNRWADSVEIHMLHGNHETLLQAPHAAALAKQLEAAIAEL